MIYQILGVILQVVGIYFFCRLGARLSDHLAKRSKWAPLAVAGPVMVAMLAIALIFHPVLTFVTQSFALWLVFFAGGMVVRMQQREYPR
jgi:zinc transporter ZupT